MNAPRQPTKGSIQRCKVLNYRLPPDFPKVPEDGYDQWLEPDDELSYAQFDAAVRQILGDALYEAAEQAARLTTVLDVTLGIEFTKQLPAHEVTLAKNIIRRADEARLAKIIFRT